MTFPLQRALALAMRQRFDNPTPNPATGELPANPVPARLVLSRSTTA